MTWKPEVDELEFRKRLAEQMGGPEGLARQRKQGKLTVRERITFVIRQVYGVAGQCQHLPTGMYRRYAWPSANWGPMPIEGGAAAAYRREIESAPDPEAKREEVERRLKTLASPFRTAEAAGPDIIDPRDTRSLLCEFIEEAQKVIKTQLGPPAAPYFP